jgi:hypothetical protein
MRRVILIGGALLLAFFAFFLLRRMLASDETRIRWMIDAMLEGFNDGRAGSVVDALASDFRDTTSGADRETVRQALVYLVMTYRDANHDFRLKGEMDVVAIDVGDEEGGKTGRAEVIVRFFETSKLSGEPVWEVKVEILLVKPESGWRIRRTTHDTLRGRRFN